MLLRRMSVVLIIILGVSFGCFKYLESVNVEEEMGLIICFGDSITEGFMLREKDSYPYQLGLLIGETVLNKGVSGETSGQGLRRLKEDVLDHQPKLVIVQFGGNDYGWQMPSEETLNNIDIMVEKIAAIGANVAIFIGDPTILQPVYIDGFRRIAQQRNILLIEGAIDEIAENPGLRLDAVHPNAQGQKVLARNVARGIKPLLQN